MSLPSSRRRDALRQLYTAKTCAAIVSRHTESRAKESRANDAGPRGLEIQSGGVREAESLLRAAPIRKERAIEPPPTFQAVSPQARSHAIAGARAPLEFSIRCHQRMQEQESARHGREPLLVQLASFVSRRSAPRSPAYPGTAAENWQRAVEFLVACGALARIESLSLIAFARTLGIL